MVAPASSSGYTVLARRFRPQAFGEVVGQEHIAQALKNAIRANRVAHAYLFTGARGVGKTSSARILAKALNCPQAIDGDPCNDCEICRGISAGNDVDVIEIDGASNRGIDEIRALRANVNVKSMRTQYKVYIIDEVHMLTTPAFNALLKTLEEPPPGVKFVFCTTEPSKVPDTILSRCQRFDFGTIATGSIKQRLQQIAEAEGVQVDDGAIELVARRAAGSMRDSQSIFDQLLAFGEVQITASDVHRLLGTASDDRLIAIIDTLVERHPSAALQSLHAALDSGAQLGELTDQILFYLRDMMILAAGATELDLLAVSSNARPILAAQAQKWGLQTIISAMQILADTKARMQRVTYGRALAELGLVRVAMLENMHSLDGLIEQLKTAEMPSALPNPSSTSDEKKKHDLADRSVVEASAAVSVGSTLKPTATTGFAERPSENSRIEATRTSQQNDTTPTVTSDVSVTAHDATIRGTFEGGLPNADSQDVASGEKSAMDAECRVKVDGPTTSSNEQVSQQGVSTPTQTLGTTLEVIALPEKRSTAPVQPISDHVTLAQDDSRHRDSMSDDDILAQYGAPPEDVVVDDGGFESPHSTLPDARPRRAQEAPDSAVQRFEKPLASIVGADVSMADLPPAFDFWQQVLNEITDMLKSHAKAVSRASYPGPGRLEITIPLKCAFSRRYVEKPDALRRLEDIATRLSNRPIRIHVTSCDDNPEGAGAGPKADGSKPARQRSYRPEEDPFVANVMQVFGAQVVKVDPLLTSANGTDDAS